ncbi:MAG: MFS transporter [Oscillochloris sp.]|nr:MFS transporter [Oscillochloris sp.]
MSAVAPKRRLLIRLDPPVWRILLHSLLFGLALSVADLLFNFYLVSLGYDAAVAGLLSTVARAAGMIMGLPIGLLIDRLGPQRAILIGLVVYALGWIALLFSSALGALITWQFVVGAAYLLAATAVTPLLTTITPDAQRATVFGMNASATLMIGLLGSVVGGLLPGLAASFAQVAPQSTEAYRIALGSVVALSIVALLPVLGALPALAEAREGAAGMAAPVTRRLRKAHLVRFALPALLLGIGGGCILPFQNLFFRQTFGMDDAAVGFTLALAAVGSGVGALLGAPLTARIGLKRGAALLRLGAVPAMLLMLTPFVWSATLGFFLRGLFIAASYPMNDALVMRATPAVQRGAAMSLMAVFWSGGWAASAALAGWAKVQFGYGPIFIVAAVTYVASAILIFTLPISDEDAR